MSWTVIFYSCASVALGSPFTVSNHLSSFSVYSGVSSFSRLSFHRSLHDLVSIFPTLQSKTDSITKRNTVFSPSFDVIPFPSCLYLLPTWRKTQMKRNKTVFFFRRFDSFGPGVSRLRSTTQTLLFRSVDYSDVRRTNMNEPMLSRWNLVPFFVYLVEGKRHTVTCSYLFSIFWYFYFYSCCAHWFWYMTLVFECLDYCRKTLKKKWILLVLASTQYTRLKQEATGINSLFFTIKIYI